MAKKGIIFDLQSNIPPTQIPPPLVTLEASAQQDPDDPDTISLNLTFKIKNAFIGERPAQLGKKGFLPFEDGTTQIKIAKFEQNQNQKLLRDDETAEFTVSLDWPGGKIGGADFLAATEEEEEKENKLS